LLYHGSNVLVKSPKIIPSAKGLDFGSGFYLTSSYEQAKRWARLITKRRRNGEAIVSVFEFTEDKMNELNHIVYDEPDNAWLEMISNNRIDPLYKSDYEIIVGPVADDDTRPTILLYLRGVLTAEVAVTNLLPRKLKDQYAFKTDKSLELLSFVRSEVV